MPKALIIGVGHTIERLVDVEVAQGALGLRSPVLVLWDLQLAEGIGFRSCHFGGWKKRYGG